MSFARPHRSLFVARCSALATLSAVILAVPSARAEDHKVVAVASFHEGTESFERKDYPAAARAFERSYAEVPRAAAIYNAARSWDAAGVLGRAADDLETAIERTDLREPEISAAKKRLQELERTLGKVQVTGRSGDRASVARGESVVVDTVIPGEVHVDAGDYVVRVEGADGATGSQPIHVDPGAIVVATVTVALPRKPPPPPSPPPNAALRATSNGSTQRTLGFVGLGLSAASVAAAAVLGLETLSARDTFRANPTSESDLDGAKAFRLGTNVAWTGAAVFTVVSIVLLATAPGGLFGSSGSGTARAVGPLDLSF